MTTLIASLPPSFAAAPSPGASSTSNPDDSDTTTFHDLLSVVNPLQHIPIVSMIYRAVTGDTIKPLERIAGDTLYGGFWGFVSSVANVAFQEATGKDFGDTALALLEGDDDDQPVGVADNAASPSASSATIAPVAVAPSTFASVAPQLIANAPAAIPQRAASATHAPRPLTARATGNSVSSQLAASAYRKTQALPSGAVPVD